MLVWSMQTLSNHNCGARMQFPAVLASDAASYATGGFHVVDGGMTIA